MRKPEEGVDRIYAAHAGGGTMKRDLESELNQGFAAYRIAATVPEVSRSFSVDIWAAIEARRSAKVFGFWAKAVTSTALAASLMLGVLTSVPEQSPEPEYLAAYLEGNAPANEDIELGYSIVDLETQR